MQIKPKLTVFNTADLTIEHPTSPEGYLFTYYPTESPEMLHFHNFLELGYCEKGSGLFNINGNLVPFNGKCSSIIYGGQPHIAQSINAEKSLWHFIYIDLNYLFANKGPIGANFLKTMKFNSWEKYNFPCILDEKKDPDFYGLCETIILESAHFKEDSIAIMQGLVYSLLKKHQRLFKDKVFEDVSKEPKKDLVQELGDVINYIAQNYTKDIKIEDLTEVAKMSKSNLQRKMIAFTGKSPLQYIHHLRMQYSAALLLDGRLSVSEIASEVGYNLSSFNRQFQKQYKCSPTQYIKNNKKVEA